MSDENVTIRQQLGLPERGRVRAYGTSRAPVRKEANRKEGHDALIDMLRHKNVRITIVAISGEEHVGRLSQSDRFTVSFFRDGEENPTIFFKHAIESFTLEILE